MAQLLYVSQVKYVKIICKEESWIQNTPNCSYMLKHVMKWKVGSLGYMSENGLTSDTYSSTVWIH